MFTRSALFYDAIYSFKNYEAEADKIHELIQQQKQSDGNTLLDVACGTAKHDTYLQAHYAISGVDLDPHMVDLARERLPDASFHVGDMRDFSLNQTFDVVMSLFSSVGYLSSADALNQAVENMAHHTKPGGVVLIEPWLTPDVFGVGRVSVVTAETEDTKIVRMTRTERIGEQGSILNFHYLIGKAESVEHFSERHDLRLHTPDEYITAFKKAGLSVYFDAEGLMGRGLYIGIRPVS